MPDLVAAPAAPAGPLTPAKRAQVLAHTAEQIPLLEENFRLAVEARRLATATRTPAADRFALDPAVSNAIEFTYLVQLQVTCLVDDLVTHHASPRGHLYARLLVLTVREATHTLQSVLGHRFRAAMQRRLGPGADASLKEAHAAVRALGEDARRQFAGVREGVVAHFDVDADRRLALLAAVDVDAAAQLAARFLAALLPASQACNRYIASVLETAAAALTPDAGGEDRSSPA